MVKCNKNAIYDLNFNKVIGLLKLKEKAEKYNDIHLRTRLLERYPDLFDHKILAEITEAYQMAVKFNSRPLLATVVSFEVYRDKFNSKFNKNRDNDKND